MPAHYSRSRAAAFCSLGGVLGLIGLAAATASPALADGGLTPHARRLVQAVGGSAGRRMGMRPVAMTGLLSPRARLRPDAASLLPLRVHVQGGAATLVRAGFAAEALSPSVAAVDLPPGELPRLRATPGVITVDGARWLRPRLDKSRPLIGADFLGDELGVRGKGVMIGVIDTGLDFRHADFRRSDGTTRIAYLVDASQRRGSAHPELPPSADMMVYTAADIDAALAAEGNGQTPALRILHVDESGHGTHVAGIAAGNGRATGKGKPAGRYVGIAPEATLCAVKGTRDGDGFTDLDIINGARFCVERAAALRMPVVVNLSLGSLGGPHDGSSPLEIALDELFGGTFHPSRALVVASGNDGEGDVHASAGILDGETEIPLRLEQHEDPTSLIGGSGVSLELFYDTRAPHRPGQTGSVEIELVSPAGKVLKVPAGMANRGLFPGEGDGIIDNSDTASTGLRGALVVVAKEAAEHEPGALRTGDWIIRLRGQTLRYDLWIVEGTPDLTARLGAHLDPDGYIEIPASARSAISVGALRSRSDWTRVDGKPVVLRRELGRVAPFSSGGPTRDGRFAPDVLAPGEFIVSSLSAGAPPGDPRSAFNVPGDLNLLVVEDGVHAVLRGTSQAAPHVTGAVALLFQLDPDLPLPRLRELLRTTTKLDASGGGYGPRRGFGTLDLRGALRVLRGASAGPVSAALSEVAVNLDVIPPGVGEAVVTVTPRDDSGVPLGAGLTLDITTSAGEWLGPVVDNGLGRYERTLRARGPRGTRASISVRVAGIDLLRHPRIDFVAERADAQSPYQIGGCGMVGRGASSSGPVAAGAAGLVATLWLVLRRRRRGDLAARAAGLALLALVTAASACSPSGNSDGADRSGAAAKPNPAAARKPIFPVGGEYYFRAPADGQLHNPALVIHLGEQRVELRDDGALIAESSVCTGRKSHKTPPGEYKILEKIPLHVSNRYGDYVDASGQVVQAGVDLLGTPIPAGAEFRGTPMPYFMRVFAGIGMHAGPLPGFPDSHGCIRLPEFMAERLFDMLPLGTPVRIVE